MQAPKAPTRLAVLHSISGARAKQTNDTRDFLPHESLEMVAACIKSGETVASKSLVITLDDSCGGYQPQLFAAGLPASQILALLDVARAIVLQSMGFIR